MEAALHEPAHTSGPPIETARFGMWLFLASETLLFAGLIGAYLFLRTGSHGFALPGAELDRGFTAGSTLALVASSFTLARAAHAPGRTARLRWLGATLLLGGGFLALQLEEYAGLLAHGLRPASSLYWSCFFVLTGVHGLHVLAGLLAIAWSGTRALRGGSVLALELTGLYWHLVDLVWIVLFVILYLV